VAEAAVENIAALMETEPMGLQFGVLAGAEPTSAFTILRARDRVSLAVNPFRPDAHPSAHTSVAMITGADEAITAHQRVAETSWREAVKGPAGAARLRQLIAQGTRACNAPLIDVSTAGRQRRWVLCCVRCQ